MKVLYRPDYTPEVDPEAAIVIVHQFLRRCLAWAEEREIPRRLAEFSVDTTERGDSTLQAWIAYREMTTHTLHELEAGTLDHWFDNALPSDTGETGVDLE